MREIDRELYKSTKRSKWIDVTGVSFLPFFAFSLTEIELMSERFRIVITLYTRNKRGAKFMDLTVKYLNYSYLYFIFYAYINFR